MTTITEKELGFRTHINMWETKKVFKGFRRTETLWIYAIWRDGAIEIHHSYNKRLGFKSITKATHTGSFHIDEKDIIQVGDTFKFKEI